MSELKTNKVSPVTGTELTLGDSGDTIILPDDSIAEAHIANDSINFVDHLKPGTDGELITWDAAGNPAPVGVGTATHVLTSGGVGVAPTFQAAAGGGKVLQVLSVINTVAVYLDQTSTWTDLTGMTVDITPSSTDSKVWVIANITGSVGTTEYGGIRLVEDGSAIGVGTSLSGAQTAMTSQGEPTVGGYTASNIPISWIASPATTSAVTYKVQMYATGKIYFNRTVSNASSAATPRTVSTLTVMELESAIITGT